MYGKTRTGVSVPILVDGSGAILAPAGRYADAVKQGNVYSGSSQTGCVWTVGLATTYTGVCVTNPAGSGKNLNILAAGFSERVAPAGIQDVWLAGAAHATAVVQSVAGTPKNMLLGSSNSATALLATGATLPTAPFYLLPLLGGKTSAALSTASIPNMVAVDGLVVVGPGAFLIIATFTVGAAVGQMGSIIWEEVAI